MDDFNNITVMYGCLGTPWEPINPIPTPTQPIYPDGTIQFVPENPLVKENKELKKQNRTLERKLLKLVDRVIKLLEG